MAIVEAAAVMTSHGRFGKGKDLAPIIEQAMHDALNQAIKDGVRWDQPNELRARMLKARAEVLKFASAPETSEVP